MRVRVWVDVFSICSYMLFARRDRNAYQLERFMIPLSHYVVFGVSAVNEQAPNAHTLYLGHTHSARWRLSPCTHVAYACWMSHTRLRCECACLHARVSSLSSWRARAFEPRARAGPCTRGGWLARSPDQASSSSSHHVRAQVPILTWPNAFNKKATSETPQAETPKR